MKKLLLGDASREIRESLGLSQREAAVSLGISAAHLCNIEKNKALPSHALAGKYQEVFGVDLYVFAWCKYGDLSRLPMSVRCAAVCLLCGWEQI